MNTQGIERFLDGEGKLKIWPAKQAMKDLACAYLAEKFDVDVTYQETEVNEIIASWHTFEDYFLLRRAMVDRRYLQRTRDGRQYWKNKERPVSTAEPDQAGRD